MSGVFGRAVHDDSDLSERVGYHVCPTDERPIDETAHRRTVTDEPLIHEPLIHERMSRLPRRAQARAGVRRASC